MAKPGEHKTVQARILTYAEAEGALLGQFHLHTDIYGNRGELVKEEVYVVKNCD